MPRPLWPATEEPKGPLFGDLKFVVAGTNRGGTTYVANVLKSLGLRSKHEGLLNNERVCRHYSRYYDCETSGGNVDLLPQAREAGLPIFHLLRHPILTLDSIWTLWRRQYRFKERYWIGAQDDDRHDAMGKWWMQHRQKIEDCSPVRVYLESPKEIFSTINDVMGFGWSESKIIQAMIANTGQGKRSARSSQQKQHRWFYWQDFSDEFRYFAKGLGYDRDEC